MLDLDIVTDLIRTEPDPAELQLKLKAMIEAAHPAPVFIDGEVITIREFERRFKKAVCDGIEPTFGQWRVRVLSDPGGEMMLALGTSLEGKCLTSSIANADGRSS